MGKLDGRVAIVTGAAYGERAALGAVYAKALAEAGASVVLSDTKECEPVVEDIHATGGKALGLTTDVTDEAQIQEMVASKPMTWLKPVWMTTSPCQSKNLPILSNI